VKTVCCVMLVNGRPEMVRRAVESFKAQDYLDASLVIWSTGPREEFCEYEDESQCIMVVHTPDFVSIGRSRNEANEWAGLLLCPDVDLFAHWDSDDWSHPKRLTEQVALLEHTGANVVGYREVLFYDQRPGQFCGAWTYRGRNPSWPVGASMMYRREVWERFPFPLHNIGEDTRWLQSGKLGKIHAVPSTWNASGPMEPRMICGIHGENTSSQIKPNSAEWRRTPEHDEYCRVRMTK